MEKISPGKQYDFYGEINPEVDDNQVCANRLNQMMDIFGLKVIGEQYRTVFLRGIGSIDLGFTLDSAKDDLRRVKQWLRNGINSI